MVEDLFYLEGRAYEVFLYKISLAYSHPKFIGFLLVEMKFDHCCMRSLRRSS